MWPALQSPRLWMPLGAVLAGMAVALGAYGWHNLEGGEAIRQTFMLSVQYHMWHALGLLAVGWHCSLGPAPARWAAVSGILFCIGILLFSGSLYVSAIMGNLPLTGATPVGGFCFMGGWGLLALATISWRK